MIGMRKSTIKVCVMTLVGSAALGIAYAAAVLPKAADCIESRRVLTEADCGKPVGEAARVRASVKDGNVFLLSEDFAKCTKGSEATPDSEGIVGELSSELTQSPGWLVATGHQAGGCMYVDLWETTTQGGQAVSVSLIDTPVVGATGGTPVRVSFRARTAGGEEAFYVINANKNTSAAVSSQSVTITGEWAEYEVWFTDCVAASYFEFQSDAPFYIDDIEVDEATPLATPKVLPATDITQTAYTANWSAVASAEGYLLYPRTIHIADGLEPFWLIHTDFDKITEGTVDNPIPPTYMVYSLDDYVDQPGWLARLPLMAGGSLGLTNRYLKEYGNSLLQSPTLNLSNEGGKVSVRLRYLAQDVDMFQVSMYQLLPNGNVSLRATKMLYTNEEYNVWKDEEFTLGGGTSSSLIVILLPETTQGTIYLDNLDMWQTPEKGERYSIPGATITATENSARVETPEAGEEDSRSYSVKAYRIVGGSSMVSGESNSIVVGADSDEIPEHLDTPQTGEVSVNGSQFTVSWQPVAGANGYEVQVYRRHEADGNESVAVIDENFDAIRVGTDDLDHPRLMSEDGYDRLDEFTNVPGWEVFQGFYVDGAVGILGYWHMLGVGCYMKSPVYDLSGNGGNMTLSLKVGTDYYEQGATVYLAHENEETGAVIYDDALELNEMSKGFHPFTKQFSNGRSDSFLVFYPYGYGMSYFDDILVTQTIPAGISDTRVSHRITGSTHITMTVPQVNTADKYYCTVRALWLDNMDNEKVSSEPTAPVMIEGLVPATYYSGKVLDEEGNGVAGATVTLIPTGDGEACATTSNRWGLFRVENVSRSDVDYTAVVSAEGYRTTTLTGVRFEGLNPITDVEIVLRKANDNSLEIGTPTGSAEVGALDLQYNNSDTETVYPAELLNIPAKSTILGISYDGYCETEKEVKCNVSIRLRNELANVTGYTEAVPVMTGEDFEFWSGEVVLNQGGTPTVPAELLHFENEEGFEYAGGALRVALQSRATRNSDFFFLVDATRKLTSIYRYWSRGAEGEWQMNEYGLPVMRITYKKYDGITETLVVGGMPYTVRSKAAGLEVAAFADCTVDVFNTLGVKVASLALRDGDVRSLPLAPGVYIAGRTKIAVK